MVLKRKRSDSELSFSSGGTSSQFSSPPRPMGLGHSFDFTMETDRLFSPFAATRPSIIPSHLPSRTMKRFRDNRPRDHDVHEHTLHLLYTAQKQQNNTHDTPSAVELYPDSSTSRPALEDPHPAPDARSRDTTQRSLHSFWAVLSPPTCHSSASTSSSSGSVTAATNAASTTSSTTSFGAATTDVYPSPSADVVAFPSLDAGHQLESGMDVDMGGVGDVGGAVLRQYLVCVGGGGL